MTNAISSVVRSRSEREMLTLHRTSVGVVLSDEPTEVGGSGLGPTPVELVLAAWAGCLVATARLVAQERGLVLGAMTVETRGEIDPRRAMGDRSAPAGLVMAQATLAVGNPGAPLEWLKQEVEARCPVTGLIRASGGTEPHVAFRAA